MKNRHLVTEASIIPLDGKSREDCFICDEDYVKLLKDAEARKSFIEALGKDKVIVGRLGRLVDENSDTYVSFVDEFNPIYMNKEALWKKI